MASLEPGSGDKLPRLRTVSQTQSRLGLPEIARSRRERLVSAWSGSKRLGMFVVDNATAEVIRRTWQEQGELAALVELRRHFPLIADNARARPCLQAIVGWTLRAAPEPGQG